MNSFQRLLELIGKTSPFRKGHLRILRCRSWTLQTERNSTTITIFLNKGNTTLLIDLTLRYHHSRLHKISQKFIWKILLTQNEFIAL